MPTGGYGPQPTSDYNNYGGGEPCEVSTTTLFQTYRFLLHLHLSTLFKLMIFFTILLFRLQVIASGLITQPLVTLVHSRDPKLEPENIPMRSE